MGFIMDKLKGAFGVKRYEPVDDSEESIRTDEKVAALVSGWHFQAKQSTQLPWVIATFVLTILATIFFIQGLQTSSRGSLEKGYSSDLGERSICAVILLLDGRLLNINKKLTFRVAALATPAIHVEQIRFTGGIKFDDNGTMYRAIEPGAQYVGRPGPVLDENWDKLIGSMAKIMK
jgi:hypothetical protein